MPFERYIPAPATWIRYTGVWDMQNLYEGVVDWFRKKKYKFHERIYKHKSPSPYGVERQYVWSAERKESEYVQVEYNVYIHTYDAHDVEVTAKDGTKNTYTKGRIWIELKNVVVFDWEGKWDSKAFFKHLKHFYNKYVIKKRIIQIYSPRFRTELYELNARIKELLKMQTEGFEHRDVSGVHQRL
tara:strand:+ start:46 stop:600 length:555 start_codon:yes stop_codon:yes gene_type:complete